MRHVPKPSAATLSPPGSVTIGVGFVLVMRK
jgi:hypothetical protein